MSLELHHLRCFVAVAEELHFRRAARRVGLTQPTLSHQIAQLEGRLGVKLLERSQRQVALTDAGSTLLCGARKILREVDTVVDKTRRSGGAVKNTLTIGYLEYMNLAFLAPTLRRMQEKYPDIEVSCRDEPLLEQLASLEEGTIDVCFPVLRGLPMIEAIHPSFVRRPLLDGEWMLVVPAKHRLASLEKIAVAELARERLIMFARHLGPPSFDWLIGLCADAGFRATVAYETSQPSMGLALVEEGVGVYVVASYVLRDLPPTLVARPLTGFDNHLTVGAVWREDNRSETLKAFLDVLGPGSKRKKPTVKRRSA